MLSARQVLNTSVWTLAMVMLTFSLQAQTDTTKRQGIDSFLLTRPGIIGDLAKNLFTDTSQEAPVTGVQRNDRPFQRYRNRIIRNIYIQPLDFGVSLGDTTKAFKNSLTRLANNMHRKSRNFVIRKNLFFRENDRLHPFLMADNERHLRDQEYLQDARILVRSVPGSRDSVDVTVLTKDVFSIGGRFRMHNISSVSTEIREDNLAGIGDRLALRLLYDHDRRKRLGLGTEYIARNIAGSFIDGYAGILNFRDAFNSGNEEETSTYLRFIKPLVNPYMRWTYALDISHNYTDNMYNTDSLYQSDWQYEYFSTDAWAALNMSADNLLRNKSYENRLRKLVGIRFFQQRFGLMPTRFEGGYNWRYADVTALLASFTIFRQDYYKTQYIYGFGRNEDVPEGIDISLTTGWTKKAGRERPYMGLDFQRYYFTGTEHYFSYTARAGAYLHSKNVEDVDVLLNLDYFSNLRQLGRWKQRTFLGVGIGRQINKGLNQPLFIRNGFGLPEFDNGELPGDTRIALRSEGVFFSPWNFINFRFAPFIFGNAAMFTPEGNKFSDSKLLSSVGAGIRTRNEALIFGTLELKGYYFPRKNFLNESFRVEFNSNVRFRYNRQFIKRPEFVQVN
jgi:hypothetical protein